MQFEFKNAERQRNTGGIFERSAPAYSIFHRLFHKNGKPENSRGSHTRHSHKTPEKQSETEIESAYPIIRIEVAQKSVHSFYREQNTSKSGLVVHQSKLSKIYRKIGEAAVKSAILLIKGYKLFISPFLPSTCRFYPTCSEYSIQAISKYGIFKGGIKAGFRVLRCNPLSKGGYDPLK